MKAEDIRTKTQDQLTDDLASLKKEQFNLRFQKATGQLEKTARVREVRRDIAGEQAVANLRGDSGWTDQARSHLVLRRRAGGADHDAERLRADARPVHHQQREHALRGEGHGCAGPRTDAARHRH